MPHIAFTSSAQKRKLLDLSKEHETFIRMERELAHFVQQKQAETGKGLASVFEILGVPTDGRVVIINNGTEDPAQAGVHWEDEDTMLDPVKKAWIPRTEAQKADFLKRFPGSASASKKVDDAAGLPADPASPAGAHSEVPNSQASAPDAPGSSARSRRRRP